jgi:hypothetical protein
LGVVGVAGVAGVAGVVGVVPVLAAFTLVHFPPAALHWADRVEPATLVSAISLLSLPTQ